MGECTNIDDPPALNNPSQLLLFFSSFLQLLYFSSYKKKWEKNPNSLGVASYHGKLGYMTQGCTSVGRVETHRLIQCRFSKIETNLLNRRYHHRSSFCWFGRSVFDKPILFLFPINDESCRGGALGCEGMGSSWSALSSGRHISVKKKGTGCKSFFFLSFIHISVSRSVWTDLP